MNRILNIVITSALIVVTAEAAIRREDSLLARLRRLMTE
jgi:hypothetical protein